MKKCMGLLACLLMQLLSATPQEQTTAVQKQTPQEKETFYESYLAKYYPRALVIRGQFLAHMTPEGVDRILDEVVTIFKTNAAFYFFDDVNRVQIGFHLEVVIDQLSLISEFLKKAYVDLETNELFLLEPLKFGMGSSRLNCTFLREAKKNKKPMKLLLTFLREKRLTAVARFYATYFDFLIKLFNEGVLFLNEAQAKRYQHELEFVMTKLKGSEFERTYQEPFNVCKDLLTILQTRISNDAKDDFDAGYESGKPHRDMGTYHG